MKVLVLRDPGYKSYTGETFGITIEESLDVLEGFDLLVTTLNTAGGKPQPIEKNFRNCLIVSERNYEHRMYEQLGSKKYGVHCERRETKCKIDFEKFINGVLFSLAADELDIRRAGKLGEKFGTVDKNVV